MWIRRRFYAIGSDEGTVGVYGSEEDAQAEIAPEKREDATWERTKELMRATVHTIMAEFSVRMELALGRAKFRLDEDPE